MDGAKAQVGFVCMALAHLEQNGPRPDHLTVHEGAWAYCPRDAKADAHEWKPTGGVALGDLELVVRRLRLKNGHDHSVPPAAGARRKRTPVR
jgi:hypothetical protein